MFFLTMGFTQSRRTGRVDVGLLRRCLRSSGIGQQYLRFPYGFGKLISLPRTSCVARNGELIPDARARSKDPQNFGFISMSLNSPVVASCLNSTMATPCQLRTSSVLEPN